MVPATSKAPKGFSPKASDLFLANTLHSTLFLNVQIQDWIFEALAYVKLVLPSSIGRA